MPKRTDISSIPPSPPSGGEGKLRVAKQGEGGVFIRGDGCDCLRSLALRACTSPPKGGEGGLFPILADGMQDHSGDAFGVFEDVAVGEADDFVAFAFHEGGARGVMGFLSGVAVAVEFDDEVVGSGGEVGGVMRAEHHLADELDALQPATAQDGPKLRFGRRHFGAELFGACAVGDVAFRQSTAPSPWRFAPFPLPLKGAKEFGNASHHA